MSKGFSGDVNGVLLWEPTFPWCLLEITHIKFQVLWKEGLLRIAGGLKNVSKVYRTVVWRKLEEMAAFRKQMILSSSQSSFLDLFFVFQTQ